MGTVVVGIAGLSILGAALPGARVDAQSTSAGSRTAQGPRTASAPPDNEIYLVPLTVRGDSLKLGAPLNLTRRAGYDNQPAFAQNSRSIFYTTQRDGQTDIHQFDLSTGLSLPVLKSSPESEYSAAPTTDGKAIAVVRVEADSTQRLWQIPLDGSSPRVLFPNIKPVGYFAQANDSTWAMFVLGSPATLQIANVTRGVGEVVASNVGRSVLRIPGTGDVSFVQKGSTPWKVMRLNPETRVTAEITTLPGTSEDIAWVDSTTLLVGNGEKLQFWKRGSGWQTLGDLGFAHLRGISRLSVSPNRQWIALVANAVPRTAASASQTPAARWVDNIDPASVKRGIETLAADSMEGRMTGTVGMERAAKWLESQYKAAGLKPAGDSGTYRQNIPLRKAPPTAQAAAGARPRLSIVPTWDEWNRLPADQRVLTQNVAAVLEGSDPVLRDEVVLVTAHYDHLGYGRPIDGDSLYNGADDDASGNIALVEIAKALRTGPRPKRTILFVSITGEEIGGFGTQWYLQHPIRPLDKTVVDLNIEMIGNADSLAGGRGKAWLTGYERSTLGDLLADNGIPLVLDPRPGQNFFNRSDNAAFARIGIPAHSLSSFNLATPYHHPADEPEVMDIEHMTKVIQATARAVRLLADGDKPTWHPGGQPEARRR